MRGDASVSRNSAWEVRRSVLAERWLLPSGLLILSPLSMCEAYEDADVGVEIWLKGDPEYLLEDVADVSCRGKAG